MSAVGLKGLNFITMDMTWDVVLLSLSKKRLKNTFQAQMVPATAD